MSCAKVPVVSAFGGLIAVIWIVLLLLSPKSASAKAERPSGVIAVTVISAGTPSVRVTTAVPSSPVTALDEIVPAEDGVMPKLTTTPGTGLPNSSSTVAVKFTLEPTGSDEG